MSRVLFSRKLSWRRSFPLGSSFALLETLLTFFRCPFPSLSFCLRFYCKEKEVYCIHLSQLESLSQLQLFLLQQKSWQLPAQLKERRRRPVSRYFTRIITCERWWWWSWVSCKCFIIISFISLKEFLPSFRLEWLQRESHLNLDYFSLLWLLLSQVILHASCCFFLRKKESGGKISQMSL